MFDDICIDTDICVLDVQPNRIFMSIVLNLMQEDNQFLSWQLVFGKTFHLRRLQCVCISEANKMLLRVGTKTELIFH